MKIAVATENNYVSGHFGKCRQFTVYEVEGKKILGQAVLDTTEHGHGLLPAYLASKGVGTVIAGGMGDGARQNLISLGISVVTVAGGTVGEVVQQYLDGSLEVNEGGCHGHSHHGEHSCNCHGH